MPAAGCDLTLQFWVDLPAGIKVDFSVNFAMIMN